MLENTLESHLDNKEIKPVNPKGNQPWIFIGRTDAKAETALLWPPDAKTQLIGKDPDAGKDWRQEEKGWQRMGWVDGITDSIDMSLSIWEIVKDREALHDAIHWVKECQTWLGSWTITIALILFFSAEKIQNISTRFFSFFSDLLYLSTSFPFLLHGLSSNAYNLIQRSGSWSSSYCIVVIPEKYDLPLDFNYWNVVDPINYISSLELSPKVCILF